MPLQLDNNNQTITGKNQAKSSKKFAFESEEKLYKASALLNFASNQDLNLDRENVRKNRKSGIFGVKR